MGTVFLGTGRKARAIGAGGGHTCALLDNGRVRCWGYGSLGELGYGNTDDIGDNELPGSVGPVSLGRKAVAIGVGEYLNCAILDNGKVRCWGEGDSGQLGLGATNHIGDNELPTSVPAVNLGGRRAISVAAGYDSACAILSTGRVRCWGFGGNGQLGYGNANNIGDNELPNAVDPVSLGSGRTARAIAAGWLTRARSSTTAGCAAGARRCGAARIRQHDDDRRQRDAEHGRTGGRRRPQQYVMLPCSCRLLRSVDLLYSMPDACPVGPLVEVGTAQPPKSMRPGLRSSGFNSGRAALFRVGNLRLSGHTIIVNGGADPLLISATRFDSF